LAEQTTNPFELFGAMTIGEESVVANAHEGLGQDMKEKAAEELDGIEGHDALSISVGVVLPSERDFAVVGRQ
jgi:hypothetical protein